MKARERRLLMFFLVIGVLGALAVVSLYLPVRAGLLNRRILGFALARANAVLAGEVYIEDLAGDPLNDFTLARVRLADADGREVLRAQRVKVKWWLFRTSFFKPELEISVEEGFFRLAKSDDSWNVLRVRRAAPKERKKRGGPWIPPARAEVSLESCDFELSYADRTLRSYLPLGRAEINSGDGAVRFEVLELRASVESPALGINHLSGRGMAAPFQGAWDVRLFQGRLVTASSTATLDFFRYFTGTKEIELSAPGFELAPDAISLLWPGHPFGIPVKGSGRASGTTDEVEFKVNIASSAGALDAEGSYNRPESLLEMKGSMEDFSIGEFFAKKLELEGLCGRFDLVYRSAGKGADAGPRSVNGRMSLDRFSYPGVRSFPLMGEVELKGDSYAASVLSGGTGAGMSVFVSGEAAEPYPLLVRAAFRNMDPARVFQAGPPGDLQGVFHLDGRGRSLEDFEGSGKLGLDRSEIFGTEIRSADFNYSIRRGRIRISRLKALAKGVAVDGTGWIEPLEKNRPYAFDLSARMVSTDEFERIYGSTVSVGEAGAGARVTGQADNWRVQGSAELSSIRYQKTTAQSSSVSFDLSGTGGKSIGGEVKIRAQGVEAQQVRYKEFKAPGFDFDLYARLEKAHPGKPSLGFDLDADFLEKDYRLSAKGAFSADFEAGEWTLDLADTDMTIIGQEWTLARPARISSGRDSLTVSGIELRSGESSLGLAGTVLGPELEVIASAGNFDLEPWARLLMPGETVGGVVSGSLVIKGNPQSPEIIGQAGIANPRRLGSELEQAEAWLEYSGERLKFSMRGRSEVAGRVRGNGRLPVRASLSPFALRLLWDEPMELEFTAAEMSVSMIGRVLPWIRNARGEVSVYAHILGTPAEPEWNGRADLAEVAFEVPQWGLSLSEVTGSAEFEKSRVKIPGISVRSGKGGASVSGGMRLEGYKLADMDLALSAKDFKAMNTPDMQATVDAEMKLSGDPGYPRLDGEVSFDNLVYRPPLIFAYQGMAWESEDRTIYVKGKEPPRPGSSYWLDRSSINIKADIPGTARLRNRELNILMGGELTLRKPPGGFFLLFGRLESREGWVLFQNKPFRVERGVFVFPAIPVVDPDLDILASYKAPEYKTLIKIGGSLSQPTLSIYSEPPLSQEDVLAVIIFGRPASELTEGENRALQLAGAQLVADFAAAKLGEAFPVDALVVRTGETPEEQGIGFGKYLNERLYLFYYHSFGDEAAEEFKLRYEATQRFSIEAGQDRQGEGGVDLFFSQPY